MLCLVDRKSTYCNSAIAFVKTRRKGVHVPSKPDFQPVRALPRKGQIASAPTAAGCRAVGEIHDLREPVHAESSWQATATEKAAGTRPAPRAAAAPAAAAAGAAGAAAAGKASRKTWPAAQTFLQIGGVDRQIRASRRIARPIRAPRCLRKGDKGRRIFCSAVWLLASDRGQIV